MPVDIKRPIQNNLLLIKPDIVVRITGDDILIDNEHFHLSLNYFLDIKMFLGLISI